MKIEDKMATEETDNGKEVKPINLKKMQKKKKKFTKTNYSGGGGIWRQLKKTIGSQ